MGKGNRTKSGSRESSLSKEQARILGQRDAEYRNYYAPMIRAELKQTEDGTMQSALADHAMGAVDKNYQQAKRNLTQSLDQREVEGGFRTSALTGLEVARMNAGAGAQAGAYSANKQHRTGLLNMAAGMSPRPTQAVAYHQESSSSPTGLSKYL